MSTLGILQCEAAPHGFNSSLSVLQSSLVTGGYLVADTVHMSQALGSSIALSIDTHQCPVDITPSQKTMLVPGFQEPPEAENLSELINSG